MLIHLYSEGVGGPREAWITVPPVDANGNPVPIDGGVTFTPDGTGFSIEPDPGDYKVCKVTANDDMQTSGVGTVSWSFDADRDPNEARIIAGVVDVFVEPREAVGATPEITYPPE